MINYELCTSRQHVYNVLCIGASIKQQIILKDYNMGESTNKYLFGYVTKVWEMLHLL